MQVFVFCTSYVIYCSYGPGGETVGGSVGLSFNWPEAPTRRQQVKEVASWLRGVSDDGAGTAEASGDRVHKGVAQGSQ